MTDGELNIEDFSYPGPKPKTKIAAIIMIADASEAVVRALPKRTAEDVEKAIRGIIEERMDLEQFPIATSRWQILRSSAARW